MGFSYRLVLIATPSPPPRFAFESSSFRRGAILQRMMQSATTPTRAPIIRVFSIDSTDEFVAMFKARTGYHIVEPAHMVIASYFASGLYSAQSIYNTKGTCQSLVGTASIMAQSILLCLHH
ncbi:hypothetical protein BHE74_00001626 [Ensete ventricosum]|nr:hypothetical protein BHE74_00001626 [Ensete ventricosum]